MNKLLSFSFIVVLAIAFSIGCKQDPSSTGGLNQSAPVHKIQPPAAAVSSASAAGVAAKTQNHKAATPQSVQHYKVHLIDVLKDDPTTTPIIIECDGRPLILNGDLDVTVNPSGEWHMTVSNLEEMDWGTWLAYIDGSAGVSLNDSWNETVSFFTGSSAGILYFGSGHWLENGGHYEEGQKHPVTVTMTDPFGGGYSVFGKQFTFQLSFTRDDSGEFTCEASMCK